MGLRPWALSPAFAKAKVRRSQIISKQVGEGGLNRNVTFEKLGDVMYTLNQTLKQIKVVRQRRIRLWRARGA